MIIITNNNNTISVDCSLSLNFSNLPSNSATHENTAIVIYRYLYNVFMYDKIKDCYTLGNFSSKFYQDVIANNGDIVIQVSNQRDDENITFTIWLPSFVTDYQKYILRKLNERIKKFKLTIKFHYAMWNSNYHTWESGLNNMNDLDDIFSYIDKYNAKSRKI